MYRRNGESTTPRFDGFSGRRQADIAGAPGGTIVSVSLALRYHEEHLSWRQQGFFYEYDRTRYFDRRIIENKEANDVIFLSPCFRATIKAHYTDSIKASQMTDSTSNVRRGIFFKVQMLLLFVSVGTSGLPDEEGFNYACFSI